MSERIDECMACGQTRDDHPLTKLLNEVRELRESLELIEFLSRREARFTSEHNARIMFGMIAEQAHRVLG